MGMNWAWGLIHKETRGQLFKTCREHWQQRELASWRCGLQERSQGLPMDQVHGTVPKTGAEQMGR